MFAYSEIIVCSAACTLFGIIFGGLIRLLKEKIQPYYTYTNVEDLDDEFTYMDTFEMDRAIDLRRNSDAHLFEQLPGFQAGYLGYGRDEGGGIAGRASVRVGAGAEAGAGAGAEAATDLEDRRRMALQMGQRGRRLTNGQRFRSSRYCGAGDSVTMTNYQNALNTGAEQPQPQNDRDQGGGRRSTIASTATERVDDAHGDHGIAGVHGQGSAGSSRGQQDSASTSFNDYVEDCEIEWRNNALRIQASDGVEGQGRRIVE